MQFLRGVPSITLVTAALIPIAIATIVAAPSTPQDSSADNVVVRPVDPGTALENPGMGWIFHYYDNGIRNTARGSRPRTPSTNSPG